MNDDENLVHARMRGESGDGPRNHRHPADGAILLWAPVLARGPSPSAFRHHARRPAHKGALPGLNLRLIKMLHCGKRSVARALNPSYCAQLKFMGSSCLKIVHLVA